jgi:predicted transcriptional regulator
METGMKNITFAIDDEILDKVRIVAAHKRTTVNAMVREFLAEVVGRDQRLEKAREGLRELMRNSKGRMKPDFKFNCEETHER